MVNRKCTKYFFASPYKEGVVVTSVYWIKGNVLSYGNRQCAALVRFLNDISFVIFTVRDRFVFDFYSCIRNFISGIVADCKNQVALIVEQMQRSVINRSQFVV